LNTGKIFWITKYAMTASHPFLPSSCCNLKCFQIDFIFEKKLKRHAEKQEKKTVDLSEG
jgi:hypothetical protein